MKNALGNIEGYIKRSLLQDGLTTKLTETAKLVVPAGENQGYYLGYNLGMQDGIKLALQLLNELPDDPRSTADHNRRAWHQSR